MKTRFSIRALFVAFTVMAGVCWWIAIPWKTAHQFVSMVNSKDYATAAEMFAVQGTSAMLTNWESSNSATAWVPTLSVQESIWGMLRGRRRVELAVKYLVPPDRTEAAGLFPLEASHHGIYALPASLDHNFRSSDDTNN